MHIQIEYKRFLKDIERTLQTSLIHFFAFLWRFIGWIWSGVIVSMLLGGTLGNAMYTYLTQGRFDPINAAPLVHLLTANIPLTTMILLILGGMTLGAFVAHRTSTFAISPAQQTDYTLRPVHQLDAKNFKLFRYVPHAYILRKEDQRVREVLRQLALGDETVSHQYMGVCIFGKPAQGKTRCAWEAMQTELSDWLLVRWSHERSTLLDFSQHKGKRLVLWIDDLHEFATTTEAALLNDLPRRFLEGGARLIILATCRNGEDQAQVEKHLGMLLERLVSVTLENIEMAQALDLARMLTEAEIEVQGDEFDGTPGSLILGVRRMQNRYQHLPLSSQRLLKTMKLLRSAGLYGYPETRLRAVAQDLFGFDVRDWQVAGEKLAQGDFVTRRRLPSDEWLWVPVADSYVEKVVTDYPLPKETLIAIWPDLEQSLKQSRDAEGLNSLGIAFVERLDEHQRANKKHAEVCFRAALQVYGREQTPMDWAMTQNNLGTALSDQADLAEGEEQARLLVEAIQIYHAALQVRTREQTPMDWAMTQNNLGTALRAQANLAEGEEQARLLVEAIQAYHAALQVRTREQTPMDWAGTQNNLGTALRAQANLAEGEEQARLLVEAIQAYHAALQVYSREQTPMDWAGTQNNLGAALSAQANLAEGEEQARLLVEAIQAYHAALQVYSREQTPMDWAMTQNNLGTALRAQANLAEGEEQARLLAEAIQAYRAALQVYRPEWMARRFLFVSVQIILLLLELAPLLKEKGKKDALLYEAQRHLESIVLRFQTTLDAEEQEGIQTLAQAIQEALDDDEQHIHTSN